MMNKRWTRFLILTATTLIAIAQTLVASNACMSMAYETEIPEGLEY